MPRVQFRRPLLPGGQVQQLAHALEILNIVAFCALALLGVRLWLQRRDSASFWTMLAFTALACVTILGRVVPEHPSSIVDHTVLRVALAAFLTFPFLLYRFTTAFDPPSQRVTY